MYILRQQRLILITITPISTQVALIRKLVRLELQPLNEISPLVRSDVAMLQLRWAAETMNMS
jgi:hypothetical protein